MKDLGPYCPRPVSFRPPWWRRAVPEDLWVPVVCAFLLFNLFVLALEVTS